MVNRSTGKAPFKVVYTKLPNHTTDLLKIHVPSNRPAESLAERITNTLEDVRKKLMEATATYKGKADMHRKLKTFEENDLVMVHLRKERFPVGQYSKLQAKKYSPFRVLKKINDNAYIIDLPSTWQISNSFNVSDLHEYHPLDGVSLIEDNSGSSSSKEGETNAVASTSSASST